MSSDPDEIINRTVVQYKVVGPGHAGFVVDTVRMPYGLAVEMHAVFDAKMSVMGPDPSSGEGVSVPLGAVPLGVARNLAVALLLCVYNQKPKDWGWLSEADALACLAHVSEILADATAYREPITNPVGNLMHVLRRYRLAASAVFRLRHDLSGRRRDLRSARQTIRLMEHRIEDQRLELEDRLRQRAEQQEAIRWLLIVRTWAQRMAAAHPEDVEAKGAKPLLDKTAWTTRLG
jgi:hypothetical protein